MHSNPYTFLGKCALASSVRFVFRLWLIEYKKSFINNNIHNHSSFVRIQYYTSYLVDIHIYNIYSVCIGTPIFSYTFIDCFHIYRFILFCIELVRIPRIVWWLVGFVASYAAKHGHILFAVRVFDS